jgi:homoserine O-acetyltransferase
VIRKALGALAAVFALSSGVQAQSVTAPAATAWPTTPGDVTLKAFQFHSGESLPELHLHYMTLGTPRRDAAGHVTNAVLILHGTGGTGGQFLAPQFAGELYGPGQPLDIAKYFIILPDGIGHGKSSKPSDGLHARFPHYDYDDMVEADYRLLTQHLGVDHLRLILGTSMGCMHAFVFGEAHPEFMDAMMPLACLPVEIAGRNRIWRQMTIDAIKADPAWMGGDYKSEPQAGLRGAADLLIIAGSAPIQLQKSYPTRAAAEAYEQAAVARTMASTDANDFIYQVDASRTYDPSAGLGRIQCSVMWVNSGDDFINPPELGIAEVKVKQIKRARFVLIPASDKTHGHGTHTWAAVWKSYLVELLNESGRP